MSGRVPASQTNEPTGCAWMIVIVALLAWGGLLWLGYTIWSSTQARFPDSPYLAGQWRYYVGLPLIATTLATIDAIVLWHWAKSAVWVVLVSLVLLFAVLPYLLPYTGGV